MDRRRERIRRLKVFVFLALDVLVCGWVGGAVRINEIRIEQPGADEDEYFELFSTVGGESLDDFTYLVIGDGAGKGGVIEAVVDLSGRSFALGSRHFLVAEDTFSLFGARPDWTASLNFENKDNVTHLLVRGFAGRIGQDLDADDDGILDAAPWESVIDGVSLTASLDSGDPIYAVSLGLESVGPNGNFVPAHVFRVNDSEGFAVGDFSPIGKTDTPGLPNNSSPQIALDRKIFEIQGNGASSPLVGFKVRTTGVVTGDFQSGDELRGFFLQDPTGDGNDATSDGIFVYDPNGAEVSIGDKLRVTGWVKEHYGFTEIYAVSKIEKMGKGFILPTAVRLPEAAEGELERFEGMLIQIASPMTISQNYFLGRYGQMTLSSPDDSGRPGRLFQPTSIFPPGAKSDALAAENQRRTLILDDGQDSRALGDNPDPVPYLGVAPGRALRCGDRAGNLIGVLDYGRINADRWDPERDYRLHPTEPPKFILENPRPSSAPKVEGNLRVANFNLSNYFTTIDNGDAVCGPNGISCRGADSAGERRRQREKILAAMSALGAHILGVVEVENDDGATMQDLVNGLNEAGGGKYSFIDSGAIGTDAVKVGLIYQPKIVEPEGDFMILDDAVDKRFFTKRGRPSLAQRFRHRATGDALAVVVNHFRSKGSPCDDFGDPDANDGQGNCNGIRNDAAAALVDWVSAELIAGVDSDVLILGDLNSYAKEDPIRTIEAGGFVNLIERFRGSAAYNYVFDGRAGYLHHALASRTLAVKAAGLAEWHVNADEPKVRDYNQEFQPACYFAPDAFRSSDHDPIVIGLQMGADAPKIESARWDGSAFRIQFMGLSGQSYVVEFADNLTRPDWRVRKVVVAEETGRFEFLDSNPTSAAGFYRALPYFSFAQ